MTSDIVIIDKFLGVNQKSTETLLQPGEASYMSNRIITDDLKLQKMYGYAKLFSTLGAHPVRGMWYGTLTGVDYFVFACNGHLYNHDMTAHTNADLGTLADTRTFFFVTNNVLYIGSGAELYTWNGSGSIAAAVGYTPTVVTASPPSGGGAILEGINYLSGQKIQKFSADGIAQVFQLAEYDVDSIDAVYLNGVLQTVTTDYTTTIADGTVTFVSVPLEGTNNISITWTKVTAGDRDLIVKNLYYGGVYYSRFWLYGNPDHPNTRYVSGVTMAGVSDPTYWPKYTDSTVGEFAITGICTQYSKQLIFTTGSEASAWYSEVYTRVDDTTGLVITEFPVNSINSKVGNVAPGQIQVVYNNPFTIWKGLYEWASTYVTNEKDVGYISEKIQADLDAVDLTTAITCDWSDKGLYMVCVGTRIWVFNYRIKAWYILDVAHTPTCFLVADSELYFGTSAGLIMKFDEDLGTYDGETITATWDMGYHNFGTDWIVKFVWEMGISLLPLATSHEDIYVSTDKNANFVYVGTVSYSLSNFDTWDFSTFSFETAYSPQPFRRKLRLKGINYMKIRLVNDGADGSVVPSITLPVIYDGVVNRR